MNNPMYRIIGWEQHFENNRSRTVTAARFTLIPNKFDGDRISELIDRGGAAAYGCWVAAICLTSRCQPRDGCLRRAKNKPHTPDSMARQTRLPATDFALMLDIAQDVGLIEVAGDCQETVSVVSGDCQEGVIEGKGREGKGSEGKEGKEGKENLVLSQGFDEFWKCWPKHHRKKGKEKCLHRWMIKKLHLKSDVILKSLEWHKRHHRDWQDGDGQFIPGPHPWLVDTPWLTETTELGVVKTEEQFLEVFGDAAPSSPSSLSEAYHIALGKDVP